MKLKINIKLCIFAFVAIFASILLTNKAEAAEYIWPIVGDNAAETTVDYEFYGSCYEAPIKDGKSGRNYVVDNTKWPDEQYYYAYSESHYGTDIAGVYGGVYQVASVCKGTVIATSADRMYGPSINYVDRNQRRTWQGLTDGGGYGNYIFVQEESTGRCFLYAHLKAGTINVVKGQSVEQGQVMAIMGSSGDSGHTHLHFEIRKSKDYCFTEDFYGRHSLSSKDVNSNLDPLDYIGKPSTSFSDKKRLQADNLQMDVMVRYLFESVLNRKPSKSEVAAWVNYYKTTGSVAEIISGIMLSDEANTKFGEISNLDFSKKCYEVILYRGSNYSEQEMSGHVTKLNNGTWSRKDYITMLANCDEFVNGKFQAIIDKNYARSIKYIILKGNTSMLGDFDGDGKVTISDSSYCLRLVSEISFDGDLSEYSHLLKYLDVDSDGEITTTDATYIIRYALYQDFKDLTNVSLADFVKM